MGQLPELLDPDHRATAVICVSAMSARWELIAAMGAVAATNRRVRARRSDAALISRTREGSIQVTKRSFTLYGRSTGDYYYRVRAVVGADTSDWSNGVAVRVEDRVALVARSRKTIQPMFCLPSNVSLLRFCAARGDLFSVLSLPEHYREDKAIEHVRASEVRSECWPPTRFSSAARNSAKLTPSVTALLFIRG